MMNLILQEIQGKVLKINDDIFHELCDIFLIKKYPHFSQFIRRGVVLGKQNSKRVMVFLPMASDIEYKYLEIFKNKQNIVFNVLKPISALPTKEESLRHCDIF